MSAVAMAVVVCLTLARRGLRRPVTHDGAALGTEGATPPAGDSLDGAAQRGVDPERSGT